MKMGLPQRKLVFQPHLLRGAMLVLGRVTLVSPGAMCEALNISKAVATQFIGFLEMKGFFQPCDPELARKHEVFFDQYLIEKQEEEGDRNLTGHVPISVCPSS